MTLCFNNSCKQPITKGGDLKAVVDLAINGKQNYTKSNLLLIDQFGDSIISKMSFRKTPINALKNLNLLMPDIQKRINKKGYDALYHTYLILTFQDGRTISIEKNSVISISTNTQPRANSSEINIDNVPSGITLSQLLKNTRAKMGDNLYFSYNSLRNNCQDFQIAILKSNGISSADVEAFIKQNTGGILKGKKNTKKIINLATKTGAILETLIN